jgi:enamine deaminase RidA (YjgF/YER057c/UK114 family)
MIEEKIKKLIGMDLPSFPKPLASYIPAMQVGNLVMTAGQIPLLEGKLLAEGKIGKNITEEKGIECARMCAINCLAAIKSVIGNLDRIERVLKLTVFVNSAENFHTQHKVANGASELIGQIFGDSGKHVRSAVGVNELPINAPVEIEMIVQVK